MNFTYKGKTVDIDRTAPITEISDILIYELDMDIDKADEVALRIAI